MKQTLKSQPTGNANERFGFSMSISFCRAMSGVVLAIGSPSMPFSFKKSNYSGCLTFIFFIVFFFLIFY
jgi:hypothetical protein